MVRGMARIRTVATAALIGFVALAGCGRDGGDESPEKPVLGAKGTKKEAASDLGFPAFATKNTTRVGGADGIANAAAIARAVYPGDHAADEAGGGGASRTRRTGASALAANVLMSPPIRAPLILSKGRTLPPASEQALNALAPTGLGGERRRAGDPRGRRGPAGGPEVDRRRGADPFTLARRLDALQAALRGRTSDAVLVVSAEDPAYAMPAAGWAAKSGDPILFVNRRSVPRGHARRDPQPPAAADLCPGPEQGHRAAGDAGAAQAGAGHPRRRA